MSTTISATGSQNAAGTATAGSTQKADSTQKSDELATKDTFLQLMVAQLKYQNPMSPADGVQFLSQLSQITELEQVMTMRQDMSAIRKVLEGTPASTTPSKPNASEGAKTATPTAGASDNSQKSNAN